jgi:hypothetical protein
LGQERDVDDVVVERSDEGDRLVQRGQHTETQEVELHQADRGAIVLVPLQDAAVLHASPLDRAHLDDGTIADHHATGVDAEVPRKVLDLRGEIEHVGGQGVDRGRGVGVCGLGGKRRPAVDHLGERILLTRGVAESLGHVAHRRFGPIRDDVGDLRRVQATVLLVHVLDHLFAAAALDVDVDVGRTVSLGGQEPLEQQPERDRIGVGDAQRVADRGVGRRASPLAEDVVALAELHQVPNHEEITGKAELGDERELVIDLRVRPSYPRLLARSIPGGGTELGDMTQVRHLVEPLGTVERGQRRRHQREIERAGAPQLGRPLDDPRIAGETRPLLGPTAQVCSRGGRQPPVDLVEAASSPHCGQRRGQLAARRRVVVDVVGGHHADVGGHSQSRQRVVAHRVDGMPVVPQLDEHVVPAEHVDQLAEGAARGAGAFSLERRGHSALTACRHDRPVVSAPGAVPRTAHQRGQIVEGQSRRALLSRQVRRADGAGQGGVARRIARDHQQVLAVRVGPAGFVTAAAGEGELAAEHRGEAVGSRCFGEADDAVEAVVIGERQRLEPQPHRLFDQLLGMGPAVEEAEVGVAVQLGVRHRGRPRPLPRPGGHRRGGVRRTLVRPGRAVSPVAGIPAPQRAVGPRATAPPATGPLATGE